MFSLNVLLNVEISEDQKESIKYDMLGSDNLSDQYYTDTYINYLNDPSESNQFTLEQRLKIMISRIFQLGEIHIF